MRAAEANVEEFLHDVDLQSGRFWVSSWLAVMVDGNALPRSRIDSYLGQRLGLRFEGWLFWRRCFFCCSGSLQKFGSWSHNECNVVVTARP